MEYVPGGELFEYIKKQKGMAESDAKEMFREILQGVKHCHDNGIAHRDLKLENILLDNNCKPKVRDRIIVYSEIQFISTLYPTLSDLIYCISHLANQIHTANNDVPLIHSHLLHLQVADFGFSKEITSESQIASSVGSLLYSSPEIIERKPYQGTECDIWSLGVILYVMLTASMPFDDTNLGEFLVKISTGNYPDPVGASDGKYCLSFFCKNKVNSFEVLYTVC